MNRPLPPSSPEGQRSYAERNSTALVTAWVSGVFSAAVILLLVFNYAASRLKDPLDSDEMRGLKEQLAKRKKDDALKDRIRALDLQLREDYFRRQTREIQGGWLLLAGGAVFFLSLRLAAGYRPVPPQPPAPAGETGSSARSAGRARWSVAVVGMLALAGGGALLLGPYATAPVAEANGTDAAAAETPEAPPSDEDMARNWPRFRGPNGLGISPHPHVPATWNGKTGENIRWKTALPLPGASSPVVWDNRIFLTGANETQREVYCMDAETGTLSWKQNVLTPSTPRQPPKSGKDTGLAACTPATDGRRVYAIFANGDLAAFDFSGKQVWARSLGLPKNKYGHAASLLTCGNLLIVPWDQDVNAKLLALNSRTGKTVWEVPRSYDSSWATPVVAPTASGGLVITCAKPKVIAYSVATGKEAWFVTGLGDDMAPSPVFAKGLVFAACAHAKAFAIKTDGQGDVTKTHVVWSAEDGLPDTASPLTDGQQLWLVTSEGVLTCYAVDDGKKLYEQDLEEGCYASPSLAGGRLILFTMSGVAIFVDPGKVFKELGRAELGEKEMVEKREEVKAEEKKKEKAREQVFASPAFQDGRIYVRGEKYLYCIGGGAEQKK
ncbi:MAG: PQQ-binding-like beta-propeller repeat protein [Planctomycetota bacterium]